MVSFFPREFSSLFRVSRGQLGRCSGNSAGSRCVTSSGKLSSAIVEFVAPLRLWHSLRLPPMVGSEVSVQRTGALEGAVAKTGSVASTSSTEFNRVKREERERAHSRVVLNCPSLDIAHIRLIQSERRYGAEPRLHGWFLQSPFHVRKDNLFLPLLLKLLSGLHIYNITTFVIVLIHKILQPFIKV